MVSRRHFLKASTALLTSVGLSPLRSYGFFPPLLSKWTSAVSVGLFSGGYTTTYTTNTYLYSYAGGTFSAGTNLSTARHNHAAAGTSTAGIIAGGVYSGGNTASTEKYTYSSNALSAGTNLTTARYGISSTGTSTLGFFNGGYTTASVAVTDFYTYATDTVTSSTSGPPGVNGAAVGTPSVAVIGVGGTSLAFGSIAMNIYDYSSSTWVGSGANHFNTSTQLLSASGNSTKGIFCGGSPAANGVAPSTNVYTFTFGTSTIATGTSLTYARAGLAGTGNASIGVHAGGMLSTTNYTYNELYNYSAGTWSTGTALSTAKTKMAASSSTPGGF